MGTIMQQVTEIRAAAGIRPEPTKKFTVALPGSVAQVVADACAAEEIGPTEFIRRLVLWYAGASEDYELFFDGAAEAVQSGIKRFYESMPEASRARFDAPTVPTRRQVADSLTVAVGWAEHMTPSMRRRVEVEGGDVTDTQK